MLMSLTGMRSMWGRMRMLASAWSAAVASVPAVAHFKPLTPSSGLRVRESGEIPQVSALLPDLCKKPEDLCSWTSVPAVN